MTNKFALTKIKKTIREAGAQRISKPAIKQLNEHLLDFGTKIAKYAFQLAQHTGRKTIKESDIKLAVIKMDLGSPPKIIRGKFASARVEKIIRDVGAFRVSLGAIRELNDILSTRGSCVAETAVEFARHNKRKTLSDIDMKLASQKTHWC